MDLFSLLSAPNPAKVKTGTRPRAAHAVPLLTATASHVIDMKDTAAATAEIIPEPRLEKEVAVIAPLMKKNRHKRGNEGAEANAPPKALRKDHAAFRPVHNTLRGKSIVPIGLDTGSTISAPAKQDTPTATKSVSDPNPLSYARHYPVNLLGKWPPRSPLGMFLPRRCKACSLRRVRSQENQLPSHLGTGHQEGRCPQYIRDLRPSSSQLKIPIYPKVCDPEDLWSFKEEVLLEDAIAANRSWAEKKKKCRV
nr:hypothetical protein [Tanacetum cinerariifolium]